MRNDIDYGNSKNGRQFSVRKHGTPRLMDVAFRSYVRNVLVQETVFRAYVCIARGKAGPKVISSKKSEAEGGIIVLPQYFRIQANSSG